MMWKNGYRFRRRINSRGRGVLRQALKLGLVLEQRLVFKAVVAGQPAHQIAPLLVIKDTADIYAGDAGHSGEIALSDLLPDDDAARADNLATILSQFEKRTGHAAAQRQKTPRGDGRIGLAQARRKQRQ